MLTVNGSLKLRKGDKIEYKDPVLEVVPHIFPNFEALNVDVRLYVADVDENGEPVLDENDQPVLKLITSKSYFFASDDLKEEEPQIAQRLKQLQAAIEKTVRKDLLKYNNNIDINR